MSASRSLGNWPPLLAITLIAVAFYYPVLFQSMAQIHGESVSLGVALMHMLSASLHGDAGALWTTGIYGGHPVFAEGQGGFANPLHLAAAWLLPPVQAYNVIQFVGALVAGLGSYGMCRANDCGRTASTFGALALVFSTLWISGRANLAIGSTMAWIPWAFWALRAWLQRADVVSACAFGVVMALMLLSGYPQLVHGVIIYLAIYLLVFGLSRQGRGDVRGRLGALAASLALAVLLCIGLSAIQWLPLLELAGESHRSGGIALGGLDGAPPETILRGFLYTIPTAQSSANGFSNSGTIDFPALGSLLVCLLFSCAVFVRRNPRIPGHVVATAVLVVLGLGSRGTPVFAWLYDYHLIPGLHSFRVTFVYLYVALVGLCLVSALALDNLSRTAPAATGPGAPTRSVAALPPALLAVWSLLWLLVLWYLHHPAVPLLQYALAGVWLAACGVALALRSGRWLPALALALLCTEILTLRLHLVAFGDAGLIAKPVSLEALEERGDLRDYKFADRSVAVNYSFLDSKSPLVVWGLRKMLASLTPAANTLWDTSSLMGNMALQLRRRSLADPLIFEELRNANRATPGLRLIDFVSLKYVSVGAPFAKPGFADVYSDPELQVRIVENAGAQPRFQFFDEAVYVRDPDAAAAALGSLRRRLLVVEADPAPAPATGRADSTPPPSYDLLLDRPDHYEFDIDTAAPVWFFLADANYPGWRAYLDDRETRVYSAQLLGKAMLVPAGEHRLSVVFRSGSFRLGLVLTLASITLLMLLLAVGWRRAIIRRKGPSSIVAQQGRALWSP